MAAQDGPPEFIFGDMEMIFEEEDQQDAFALDTSPLAFFENQRDSGGGGMLPPPAPASATTTAATTTPAAAPEVSAARTEVRNSLALPEPAPLETKRSSFTDDGDNGKKSWHNDITDKEPRLAMIREISRLLKSRKKSQPTDEWLQQLPHKARKLEERLYRNASSLSAYQDLTTLKNRLKAVAQMITKQYTAAKSRHSFLSNARRSTVSSMTSATLSLASRSQRDSVTSQMSLGSVNSKQDNSAIRQFSNLLSSLDTNYNSAVTPDGDNFRSSFMDSKTRSSLKVIPETGSSLDLSNADSVASTSGDKLSQDAQQGGMVPPPNQNSEDGNSASLLEQQKALNEKLRKQIEENLRKQNELVRQLQAQQQQTAVLQGTNMANFGTNLGSNSSISNPAAMPGPVGSMSNAPGPNVQMQLLHRNASQGSLPGGSLPRQSSSASIGVPNASMGLAAMQNQPQFNMGGLQGVNPMQSIANMQNMVNLQAMANMQGMGGGVSFGGSGLMNNQAQMQALMAGGMNPLQAAQMQGGMQMQANASAGNAAQQQQFSQQMNMLRGVNNFNQQGE